MDRTIRNLPATFALSVALLLGLTACTGNEPIPSGAQQVQVSVDDTGVVLQPDTVASGDVYLVLDAGSISFVERKAGPYASAGPLTDEQIAAVGEGNLQDTSSSSLEAESCDANQRAAARGMTGPCGNVMLVQVQPGRYLIVSGTAEEAGSPSAILSITP